VRGYNRGAISRSDSTSSKPVITMRRVLIILGFVLVVVIVKTVMG